MIVCGFCLEKANLCRFCIVCLYVFCHWGSSYQEGKVGIPVIGFTPLFLYACATTRLGFPTSYVEVFSYFQWVKVWGDHCSFCWYWWKCWPSLLKCTVNSFLFNGFMIFFYYFLRFVISWFANLAMWFKYVFQYQLKMTLKRSCIFRELLAALVQ